MRADRNHDKKCAHDLNMSTCNTRVSERHCRLSSPSSLPKFLQHTAMQVSHIHSKPVLFSLVEYYGLLTMSFQITCSKVLPSGICYSGIGEYVAPVHIPVSN